MDGIDFSIEIYEKTESFPSHERFGLISQLRRAAVSIPSNIAEGASRKSNLEFARFIEIALGSAFEIETQLIIAFRRNYLPKLVVDELLPKLHSIQRRANALHTKLVNEPPNQKAKAQ